MSKVGFTGTQKGMTLPQAEAVRNLLGELGATRTFHGGCIGADTQFHNLSLQFGIKPIIFPSNIRNTQGDWVGAKEVYSPLPPLQRNRIIVDHSDILLATPKANKEEIRSGTWATIRYARGIRKPVIIIYPEGNMERR